MERRLRLLKDELTRVLDAAFPVETRPHLGEVALLALDHLQMRLRPLPAMLRPGGIVSGPAQVALIDVAAYAVVLAHIGAVEMAVTSTMAVHFLRPCKMEQMTADARLLKLGRRIAMVDVRLWQQSEDRIVSQASVTYALP